MNVLVKMLFVQAVWVVALSGQRRSWLSREKAHLCCLFWGGWEVGEWEGLTLQASAHLLTL